MRRLLLSLLVWSLASQAGAQAPIGTIAREVPGQIGVYDVTLHEGAQSLKQSDIVHIRHGGKTAGEAFVLEAGNGRARITLRGVYDVEAGDTVEFARSPQGPAAGAALGSGVLTCARIMDVEVDPDWRYEDGGSISVPGGPELGYIGEKGWNDSWGADHADKSDLPLYFVRTSYSSSHPQFNVYKPTTMTIVFEDGRRVPVRLPGYRVDKRGQAVTEEGRKLVDRKLFLGADGRSYLDPEGKLPAIEGW